MELTGIGILLLGLVIGLQHALEIDHIAAVSSMAAGETSLKRTLGHGAMWGAGHTVTLFAFAGSAIYLGTGIDDAVAGGLEFAVGVMLVGLGGHVLYRLVRDRVHFHQHRHADGTAHFHAHAHGAEVQPHRRSPHAHVHAQGLPVRAFAVGLMHGLAGSAALVVLSAPAIGDPVQGLAYVLLFGVGSMLGMAALSAVIAVPLGYTAQSLTWLNRGLRGTVGIATVAIGLFIMQKTWTLTWLG